MGEPEMYAEMGKYNEELVNAGIMLSKDDDAVSTDDLRDAHRTRSTGVSSNNGDTPDDRRVRNRRIFRHREEASTTDRAHHRERYECPHCRAEFKQRLKFCGECGKPMEVSA